ncbi:MAG: NADH-quinone oxidoreductase subunit G [Alphaproteobacteria bacterium]|nr:NADH-quinone oxidoreductase subunit G [Alphaproteobacteria bacterium]
MPKLIIDGKEIEVMPGLTIIQACEQAGIEVPRFCYHERLSVAGNCRMCLVEVEKSPKPVASCVMPVSEGMVVKTQTDTIKKARRGVMEFLLINHPLDCPICDQGGECDLQDQAMAYGFDRSRYEENKRAVQDKNFGPLIKTSMNRCIHCTRCIRFSTEIAGVPDIGAVGRGEKMEITTYVEKAVASELSGNLIDICPVGALTSKPYAFAARPWELKKTHSIDVMDAVGSHIRVDTRGAKVLRILPRIHEDINEEWLADKSRFACDGLARQRLDRPYIRKDGRLVPTTWAEALAHTAQAIKKAQPTNMAAIAGDMADVEAMFALKELWVSLGSNNFDCRQNGSLLGAGGRATYLLNTTINNLEKADVCLLIGTNPRWEAPLINARLRKAYVQNGLKVFVIGPKIDLTYPAEYLGESPTILNEITQGTHPLSTLLQQAKKPVLILGENVTSRSDGMEIHQTSMLIAEKFGFIKADWNGFNVLHRAASRVGGLDIGFIPSEQGKSTRQILAAAKSGQLSLLYLLGADELDLQDVNNCFIIYQGHHGDIGAHRADVVLPGAAYTEKDATYVNTEGRIQQTRMATLPPGEAKEDWRIIRALSELVGKTLSFSNRHQLQQMISKKHAVFQQKNIVAVQGWVMGSGRVGNITPAPLKDAVVNYYMTDPISRASETMAACTAAFVQPNQQENKAHG